jgi:hypothetical protein
MDDTGLFGGGGVPDEPPVDPTPAIQNPSDVARARRQIAANRVTLKDLTIDPSVRTPRTSAPDLSILTGDGGSQ